MENNENETAKLPKLKSVLISYGDVAVSVDGEDLDQTKKDALEIFGILESKFRASLKKKNVNESILW